MLEILGTVFGSIFSGGATGIIGVVAQRFADYKNKQLDMQLESQRAANELLKMDKEAEIAKAEAAAKLEITRTEVAGQEAVADAATLAESFKMEPQRFAQGGLTPGQNWLMVALDALRGSVRPILTLYLCVLTTLVYTQAKDLLATSIPSVQQALELEKMIVGTILYLTTTCVLWWFGTRNKQNPPGR